VLPVSRVQDQLPDVVPRRFAAGAPQRLADAKENPESLKRAGSPASGWRYQMVTDGKQVFLVDLKEGRVWRYFQQTREGGVSKEDEGFLPLPLYFAGKKHFSASEMEASPGEAPTPPQPKAAEKPSP
jgi:hypothetical protein